MDWETFWSLHAAYTALIDDADAKRNAATSTAEKLSLLEYSRGVNAARQILFQHREKLTKAVQS